MKYGILNFLEELGIIWKFAINGLIGGAIWSIYKKSKFGEALRQVVIGGVVSGYFTPVIVSKTNMQMELVGFTSFVIGMLGMVILDSIYTHVIKLIKKWKDAVVFVNTTKSTPKTDESAEKE